MCGDKERERDRVAERDVCLLGTTQALVLWWLTEHPTSFRCSFSTSVATCGHAASLKMLRSNNSMTAMVHICCRCRPATSSAAAVQPFPYPSVSMKHLGSSRLDVPSSVHLMPSYCLQRLGLIKTRPSHCISRNEEVVQSEKRGTCRCLQRRVDPYIH